jgi:hypothetical protein
VPSEFRGDSTDFELKPILDKVMLL